MLIILQNILLNLRCLNLMIRNSAMVQERIHKEETTKSELLQNHSVNLKTLYSAFDYSRKYSAVMFRESLILRFRNSAEVLGDFTVRFYCFLTF